MNVSTLPDDVQACVLADSSSSSCDSIMNEFCAGPNGSSIYCACINSTQTCPFSNDVNCRNYQAYATLDMVNFNGKYGECKSYCNINTTITGNAISANVVQSCGTSVAESSLLDRLSIMFRLLFIIYCILDFIFATSDPIPIPKGAYSSNGFRDDYIVKY
jgi:hypothetical protein